MPEIEVGPTQHAYDKACAALNRKTDLLREVAQSGVIFDDERVDYVEVQIDRVTWDEIKRLVM